MNSRGMPIVVGLAVVLGLWASGMGADSLRAQEVRPPELSTTPNMFGDFFSPVIVFRVVDSSDYGEERAHFDAPLAAGAARASIADNNKALPQDRFYVLYNHFEGAVHHADYDSGLSRSLPTDRYTFGFEKTFLDGQWSIEARLPISGGSSYTLTSLQDPDASYYAGIEGSRLGNLFVALKHSIYSSDSTSAVAGIGVEAPTGSDVSGVLRISNVDPPVDASVSTTVRNNAVYLAPYLGLLYVPNDKWFAQGFAQVDVPLNGNPVDTALYDGEGTIRSNLGSLCDKPIVMLDASVGRWLFHDDQHRLLTGLAGVLELHYRTTLGDPSVINAYGEALLADVLSIRRVDDMTMTVGVHAEINHNALFRIGTAFSLNPQTAYASDTMAQLERRW
jgi:hypothetical protein